MPDIAMQVQQELNLIGIEGAVEARSYGEIDNCGTYNHRGIDFTISLVDAELTSQQSQQELITNILPILVEFGNPGLGNVKLISPQGELIPIDIYKELSDSQALDTEPLPADAITKQVYVIAYDPLLSN